MKYMLSLFFIFSGISAIAQVTPIYFIGDVITNNKEEATSYGIFGKLSEEELWVMKRYDLRNNLLQTGQYKDDRLRIPHGKFIFYMDIEQFNLLHDTNFKIRNKPRFISQEGNFINGAEEGKWILFYPDGNVLNVQNYSNGKLEGEFKTFDKLGEPIITGTYKNGEMDGEWWFESGTRRAIYEKGMLKSNVYVKRKKLKGTVSN